MQEKVAKANREIKIADNEYAGTRSDANHTKESEEKLDDISLEKRYCKLLSNVRKHLENKIGEDLVENIYLDTNGKITTGIGLNINKFDTFMSIDFEVDNRPATYNEKLEAYNKFMELKERKEYGKKYGADHYEKYSNLRINHKTAKNLMNRHTLNDLKKLREGIEDFDKLPLPLQEVLMDIRYNTGNVSKSNWPKLREGIRTKNLTLIADNVSRKDISAERNKWAKDKILSIKEPW